MPAVACGGFLMVDSVDVDRTTTGGVVRRGIVNVSSVDKGESLARRATFRTGRDGATCKKRLQVGLDMGGDAWHDMGVTPILNNSTTLAELVSQLYRIRPASPTRTAGFFMRQPKPKTNSV